MKVALLTGHLSGLAGGFAAAVPGLAAAVRAAGAEPHIVGLRDDHDRPGAVPLHIAAPVTEVRAYGPRPLGWSPALGRALASVGADLLHQHGIWMYASFEARRWRRRSRRPHVVSPHGMLDPWALRKSASRKRVASWLYEARNLGGADCLHALNAAEAAAFRAYGIDGPVCVVPNGVSMPAAAPSVEGARTVLFLARLVRQKGVEELIEAWSRAADAASSGGWRLRIVGWGEASFVDRLRTMAACADRRAPVDIEGPAFGKDKDRLWRDAAALVLPSRAEGLPMSVLEAWARGRAVLMSEACNLPDGFAEGAALPLSAEIASIEAALRAFFALTDSDRAAMGRAGRRLVERRYTWDRVGQQMVAVYAWLLGGGSPPSCVMTD